MEPSDSYRTIMAVALSLLNRAHKVQKRTRCCLVNSAPKEAAARALISAVAS
jgi:hypothetical protein